MITIFFYATVSLKSFYLFCKFVVSSFLHWKGWNLSKPAHNKMLPENSTPPQPDHRKYIGPIQRGHKLLIVIAIHFDMHQRHSENIYQANPLL